MLNFHHNQNFILFMRILKEKKVMSFLQYQKSSPNFLNEFLKYKRFIEFGAETTVDQLYFDLRTLLRYIKLYLYDKEKLKTITREEFKNIDISDVTITDLRKINSFDLENYINKK